MFVIVQEGFADNKTKCACGKEAEFEFAKLEASFGDWRVGDCKQVACNDCMPKESITLCHPGVQAMLPQDAIEWLLADYFRDQDADEAIQSYLNEREWF